MSRARTHACASSAVALLGALAWLAGPSCSGSTPGTTNVTGAGGVEGTDTGGSTGGGDMGAGGSNVINGSGGSPGVGGAGQACCGGGAIANRTCNTGLTCQAPDAGAGAPSCR